MGKQVSECFYDLDNGEYYDTQAFALKDQHVIIQFFRSDTGFVSWVGTQKNVHYWVVTECGHAIGANENPSFGLSFPVIKLSRKRYHALLAEHGQLSLIS